VLAAGMEKRKSEHIRICLDGNSQAKNARSGFEDVRFVHRALPEVEKLKIDLSTLVLGHRFAAPVIVGALTGGTVEATKINAVIAEVVESLHLGMGVGSQRAAIEDGTLEKTFSVVRKKAPTAFLIANLGGVQLVHGYGLKEVRKAVEMIEADAVAIHLNGLQEAVQPEGQTNFAGVLAKIGDISKDVGVPVIVKETGCGIAAEEALKLEASGVEAIDVGGLGGTSFAAVEHYRAKSAGRNVESCLGEIFWDWGIPTVASIVEVAQRVKIPVIASGGVRDGVDVAKALALKASLASVSQPVLQCAVKGLKETESFLGLLVEELRVSMFLVGARRVTDLSQASVVISGETRSWLEARGFSVDAYARRGVV
jgi:isopentenyl-diphosphate delta-isomerase